MTQEEFKTELKKVGRREAVIIASRMALRVLPILNEYPEFSGEHWFAVLYAAALAGETSAADIAAAYAYAYAYADTADTYAATYAYDVYDVYAAAAAAARAYAYAYTDAVNAYTDTAYAARAAAYAARAARARAAAYAARAARACADAYVQDIQWAFQRDIQLAAKNLNELYRTPLWHDKQSEALETLIVQMRNRLEGFQSGFEYWIAWYDMQLKGPEIPDAETVKKRYSIPDEIDGVAAKNQYLQDSLENRLTAQLSLARVIFIGDGSAGKTTLIKALNGEETDKKEESHTPGVQVSNWKAFEGDKEVVLWDFGGQVIFQSTHRFFLRKRCVYVIVLDNREHQDRVDIVTYWLEHVKAYGESAPVLIVGNKEDEAEMKLDRESLLAQDDYNIAGFYSLSARKWKQRKYKSKLKAFEKALQKEVQKILEHDLNLFRDEEYQVMQELRSEAQKHDYLEYKKYEGLCTHRSVTHRVELLKRLDQNGVLVYFEGLEYLHNFVLNPRWLTYGVYHLLDKQSLGKAQGIIPKKEIMAFYDGFKLQDEGRTLRWEGKGMFMLEAMQKFELCFPIANGKKYVFPALLPDKRPKMDFDDENTLSMDFDFSGFLPLTVISRLMVDKHEDIHDMRSWRRGMLLKNYGTFALISAATYKRVLSVKVEKQGTEFYNYLMELRGRIHTLAKEVAPGMRFYEWLHLGKNCLLEGEYPQGDPPRARVSELVQLSNAGALEYRDPENSALYDLPKLLKGMSQMEREINNYHQSTVFTKSKIQQVTVNNYQQMGESIEALEKHLRQILMKLPAKEIMQNEEGQEDVEVLGNLMGELEELKNGEGNTTTRYRLEGLIDTLSDEKTLLNRGIRLLSGGLGDVSTLVGLIKNVHDLLGGSGAK